MQHPTPERARCRKFSVLCLRSWFLPAKSPVVGEVPNEGSTCGLAYELQVA